MLGYGEITADVNLNKGLTGMMPVSVSRFSGMSLLKSPNPRGTNL